MFRIIIVTFFSYEILKYFFITKKIIYGLWFKLFVLYSYNWSLFFKSLLFLQIGYLIFLIWVIRMVVVILFWAFVSPYVGSAPGFFSLVCLCGLLFTSESCSKEYFMSRFNYGSLVLLVFFLFFIFWYEIFFCIKISMSSVL